MESNWTLNQKYQYGGFVYTYFTDKYAPDYISKLETADYSGKKSSYDSALELIAGSTDVIISAEKTKVTKTEETYKITCVVGDRFDFDTSSGLISGFAALLFTEFDWESKVSFNIKVPYSCLHGSENYHFTLDAENFVLDSENSEEFAKNGIERFLYESSSGKITYYFETERPIVLFHNKPWVLEYDIRSPRKFGFAPFRYITSKEHPSLVQNHGQTLFFWNRNCSVKGNGTVIEDDYYGTAFPEVYDKEKSSLHTFCFENVVNSDGSNMIYLTVTNIKKDKIILEKLPMDDYYKEIVANGSSPEFKNDSNNWISGKDIIINYLGNESVRLDMKEFDLRIWENGKDSEPESYFSDKTTKPTCEAKGYVTHTCSLCGYSYKDNYTAALGHNFGEWETVTAPTAENPGEEKRVCSACEMTETRVVPAFGYTLADINIDGAVNVFDAYFARLVAAKLIQPTEKQLKYGDVDGDGRITALDANIIRKFAAKIITELPVAQ